MKKKTDVNSSIEEKVEAIIKTIKKEFPDLTSIEQARTLAEIIKVSIC